MALIYTPDFSNKVKVGCEPARTQEAAFCGGFKKLYVADGAFAAEEDRGKCNFVALSDCLTSENKRRFCGQVYLSRTRSCCLADDE